MEGTQTVKPPNIFISTYPAFAYAVKGLDAPVHYATTIVHKGKELKVPMCGAMSTFMTDDIHLCSCRDCRFSFFRKYINAGVNIKTKSEGENDNEEKSDTNGIHS